METPELVLLGCGNAGTCLGLALHRAGCRIRQIFGRERSHAEKVLLETKADFVTGVSSLDLSPGVIVLSVLKDAAAQEVWSRIPFGETLVLHTAGSLPLDALSPYAANRGVLYPLQTLSRDRDPGFPRVPLFVEANSEENLARVQTLAGMISNCVRVMDSGKRKRLHLAAVFANNFSNHMFRLAERIAEKNQVDFSDLLPLIDETAAKLHSLPPEQAQTGPAVRGDRNVLAVQSARLRELFPEEPEIVRLYEMLSDSIHRDFQCKHS